MAAVHLDGCTILECLCDIRRYRRIFALSLAITALEVAGSIATNSLFLLSDAGHTCLDLVPIGIALALARMARRENGLRLRRWEKRGGLISGTLLVALMGWITCEALGRIAVPEPVSPWMAAVAAGAGYRNFRQHLLSRAIAANHAAHQGLALHIISDFWQSIAVIMGGLAILLIGEPLIDTALSLVVAAAFLFFGARLIVKTLRAT